MRASESAIPNQGPRFMFNAAYHELAAKPYLAIAVTIGLPDNDNSAVSPYMMLPYSHRTFCFCGS